MSRSKRTQKLQATTAADVVRRRVKLLRMERGWTAQQLADELAKHNPDTAFDRDVLASFETGRRANVSIDEVLLLAYVLDVAPAELVCPFDTELPVTVAGTAPAPQLLWRWLVNGKRLPGQDDTFSGTIAANLIYNNPTVPFTDDPAELAGIASNLAKQQRFITDRLQRALAVKD